MQSSSFKLNSEAQIYRAGAGAGKTTRLVSEVYEFYKEFKVSNNKEPKIILTTFTRKATQELKERLMMKAEKNNDFEFLNFVLSSSLTISTIHGLLQIFLKQFATLIELDPNFQIVDKSVHSIEAKKILKNLIEEKTKYLDLLKEIPFYQIVSHFITLSEKKLSYPNLTFFNSKDFLFYVDKEISNLSEKSNILLNSLLFEDKNGQWIDFSNDFKELSNALKNKDYLKVKTVLSQIKKPQQRSNKLVVSTSLNEDLKDFISDLKTIDFDTFSLDFFKKFEIIYSDLQSFFEDFNLLFIEYKKSSGLISLSDIEGFTQEILRTQLSRITSFSKSYDYWLIDEFQDTAPIQVDILLKIIGSQKFFIVGDPQQSIYFFRGARVRVFDEMQETITQAGGQLSLLNTNYRSHHNIMSFINYFFNNYATPFAPMNCGKSKEEKESDIYIGLFETEEDQANQIVNSILNLSKDTSFGNIAIIARKNDQLKAIAQKLKLSKIPFYLHSAQGFSKRREILDLKAFLKFLVNPHDNKNLILLLRSPWFYIPEVQIIKWVQDLDSNSYWSSFVKNQKDSVIQDLVQYRALSQEFGTSYALEKFIVNSEFLKSSYALDPTGRREANIWKFLSQIREEEKSPEFNLYKFLDFGSQFLGTENGSDESDAVSSLDSNQVQLMTVHVSKGLEFDHVIVPYIDKGPTKSYYEDFVFDEETHKWGMTLSFDTPKAITPLPLKKVLNKRVEEELAESDRLLYVAMTRAKRSLILTSSGKKDNSSWMSQSKINFDIGEYSFPDFNYKVLNKIELDSKFDLKEKSDIKVLESVYKSKEVSADSVSVTDLISKNMKSKLIPKIKAATEGIRLHKIFESLKYQDASTILKSLNEKDFKAVSWVLNQNQIPFMDILVQGYAEWGFVFKQDFTISGQIDLWAVIDDTVYILDYKTGSSDFSETAFEQLAIYKKVLSTKFKDKIIKCVVIYPFEEKILIKD